MHRARLQGETAYKAVTAILDDNLHFPRHRRLGSSKTKAHSERKRMRVLALCFASKKAFSLFLCFLSLAFFFEAQGNEMRKARSPAESEREQPCLRKATIPRKAESGSKSESKGKSEVKRDNLQLCPRKGENERRSLHQLSSDEKQALSVNSLRDKAKLLNSSFTHYSRGRERFRASARKEVQEKRVWSANETHK